MIDKLRTFINAPLTERLIIALICIKSWRALSMITPTPIYI